MSNFVHCVGCGHQLHVTAPTCPKCGAPQRGASASPQASASDAAAIPLEQVQVSETWRKRFALIEKAGGPKLKKSNTLTVGERFGLNNVVAFFLGPLYFLYLGMWKRAISYTVSAVVVVFLLALVTEALGWHGVTSSLSFGLGGFYMVVANTSYYRKMVLNDNGWW